MFNQLSLFGLEQKVFVPISDKPIFERSDEL